VANVAEDSADWIIGQLADEAYQAGQPLTDADLAFLRLPVALAEAEDHRRLFFALNNELVPLARRRMDRTKAMGHPCTKVRRGLRVPTDWQFHYQQLLAHDYPGVVAKIMQNAMLANTMAGEQQEWRSN
jgi:hypothetical protein